MKNEMVNVGENIKKLRNSRKLTLEALANDLNSLYSDRFNFNKGKLSKWENNKEEPMLSSIKLLADYYNVTIEDIYRGKTDSNITVLYEKLDDIRKHKVYQFAKYQLEEQNNVIHMSDHKTIVTNRRTAAGSALHVEDADARKEVVPSALIPKGADELVGVVGKSMEPLIMDGEEVYMRYQPSVENGEIAIVRIENEGVTCKRVYANNGTITLKSENEDYEDMHFDTSQVVVLGKVLL